MRSFFVALFTCAVASVGSASAASLLTNGGFESGNFTGWTLSADPTDDFVCQTGTTSQNSICTSFEGAFAAALGPPTLETLSQTIVTIPGDTYTVSFALRTDDQDQTPLNSFAGSFAGNQFFSETNLETSGYVQETFSGLTASSDSSVLQFSFVNRPGGFYLDGVTLSESPEPASMALFAGALLALCAYKFNERSRSFFKRAVSKL